MTLAIFVTSLVALCFHVVAILDGARPSEYGVVLFYASIFGLTYSLATFMGWG